MQFSASPPTPRSFTLTVNEDELRLIEKALQEDDSYRTSNGTQNYDVWSELHDFIVDSDIETIDVDNYTSTDNNEDDDDLPF